MLSQNAGKHSANENPSGDGDSRADPVAGLPPAVPFVREEHVLDRNAALLQVTDDVLDLPGLLNAEGCRRLVHDDELRGERGGAGNRYAGQTRAQRVHG